MTDQELYLVPIAGQAGLSQGMRVGGELLGLQKKDKKIS